MCVCVCVCACVRVCVFVCVFVRAWRLVVARACNGPRALPQEFVSIFRRGAVVAVNASRDSVKHVLGPLAESDTKLGGEITESATLPGVF